MTDPYAIEGPALISFSGGRTSAFMLHEILRAHHWTLPRDVHVTFANTGKERLETLAFVSECGSRWGVRIHWLERAPGGGFVQVGYNSASRAGEPYEQLIAEKKYLPNAVTRFCTSELKIRVMRDFAKAQGWTRWTNAIGLRYDEGMRVMKALERNESAKDPWRNAMPLATAKVTKRDVLSFWLGPTMAFPPRELPQGFDLGLRHYEGNCDLCFLKGRETLKVIMREQPGCASWWIAQESLRESRFVTEYPYATLAREVAEQPMLPGIEDGDDYDAECGLLCAADGDG